MKLAGKSEIEIGGERERKREGYEPQEPTQRERSTLEEDRDGGKKREKRTENPHPRQGLVRNLLVLSVRTEHPWKLAVRFRLGLFVTHSLRSSSSSPLSSSFPPFLPFFFLPSSISSFTFFLPLSASCHYRCPFYPTDRRCVFHRRLGRFVRARVFDESVKLPLPENREKVDEHANQHNLVWTSPIRTLERVSGRARGASNVYLGVCCLLSGRIYQRAIQSIVYYTKDSIRGFFSPFWSFRDFYVSREYHQTGTSYYW